MSFLPEIESGRTRDRMPWLVAAAVLVLGGALYALAWRDHAGALVDDAFISFRYAARWAAGAGLTWNDGTAVEGFSNPLWTLSLGVLARIGIPPDLAAPWLGLAAFLGTVLVSLRLGARRQLDGPARLLLTGGLALDVGLATWAGSGLETASCALLVALWLALALDGRGLRAGDPGGGMARGATLGLVGAALALSRPEGPVWALWGLVWLIWGAWAGRRVLLGWMAGILPALAYGAFRWIEYGSLLPNTFFAKVEPVAARSLSQAGSDLGRWAIGHAIALVLLLLLGLGARRERRGRHGATPSGPRLWALLPAGWIALQVLFVLAAGGDWMGAARYLVPVLPAVYLLAAEGWARFAGGRLRMRWAVAAGLVGAHLVLGWAVRDRIPEYTEAGRELGLWLRSAAAPGDTVAVTAAGAIPYFSELPAYDILGINDPEVAGRRVRHTGSWAPGHHRYDLDRLLDLRPRWIVWDFGIRVNEHRLRQLRTELGDPDRFDYRRALLARPRFRELYTIERGTPSGTQGAYTVFRLR